MSNSNSLSGKNILIAITGSIAAYKVCEVISTLKKNGAHVKVIATESALKFVGPASLEGLSGEAVLTDDFTDGSMMTHIQAGKWADLFLIAPATAQTLNSLASGTGHGLLLSTYLAYDAKKPLLIAPAMNTNMLMHPTTQASLQKLIDFGISILNTEGGPLACGDVGLGRLLEPTQIIAAIEERLQSKTNGISVLITAGGTKVSIDSVRSITNTSTGKTGAVLADDMYNLGYEVDLIMSADGARPKNKVNMTTFKTYEDLADALNTQLTRKKYDLIVHAAAVSDFTIDKNSVTGKLPSGQKVTLNLVPTEKLLKKIKALAPESKLVGFKLTDAKEALEQLKAIEKVFSDGADWVVHNDISEVGETAHYFRLYDPQYKLGECFKKQDLGKLILDVFNQNRRKQNLKPDSGAMEWV